VLTLTQNAGGKVPVVVVGPDQSAVTGLAFNAAGLSAKLSKGGTSAGFTLSGANWTEGSDGVYYVELAAGDTNALGAGVLLVIYNGAVYRGGFQVVAAGAGGGPDAATIADAVWDEARAGHVAAGSFGEQLDASVASRLASGTMAADVTAIKAKTDALTPAHLDVAVSSRLASGTVVADLAALATAVGGKASQASVDAMLARLRALGGEFTVIDQVVEGPDGVTSCRVRAYDSQANADAAYASSPSGGTTGLLFTWTHTFAYASGALAKGKKV
jgi:hypothetical protein